MAEIKKDEPEKKPPVEGDREEIEQAIQATIDEQAQKHQAPRVSEPSQTPESEAA